MQGGLGITYFQDTAKDMQIAAPNPFERIHILIPSLNPRRKTEATSAGSRTCKVAVGMLEMEK